MTYVIKCEIRDEKPSFLCEAGQPVEFKAVGAATAAVAEMAESLRDPEKPSYWTKLLWESNGRELPDVVKVWVESCEPIQITMTTV